MRITRPLQGFVIVAAGLVAFVGASGEASAGTCGRKSISVSVRNFTRVAFPQDGYNISFDVSDRCPNDDITEGVDISFKYKVRTKGGALLEHSGIATGSISPTQSHHSVISTFVPLGNDDANLDDVWVVDTR
jgi:hypothetical protein